MATQLNSTANVNTGSGALATKPQAFYDKLLLKLLVQSDFIHSRLAQKRPMPKRSGDTINFRKITKLTPSLTPLTEGVTPDGLNASVTAISTSTAQYGEWLHFTDLIDVTQVDDILKEYTVELARIMREKLDLLVRDVLNTGTNVMYANGRTSRATTVAGDKPAIADLRKGVLSFKRNHVKPAMNGKYVALVTPSVVHDLLDDPAFLKAYEIGQNNKPFIEGEIADVYGIKFIEAVNGYTVSNGATTPDTIHSTVLLGAGAYGITEINGEGSAKMIVKPLGSSGSDDPLNQRQSIGSKVNAFAVKRLEEQAILRYESVPTNQ